MSSDVSPALRITVQDRARHRCEYCLLHEDDAWEPHEADHIIARKHSGLTELINLAWTCSICNRHKGSDIASIDEISGNVVRLFHPRRDSWARHFKLVRGRIVPRTSVGRVTAFLLQLNRPDRVRVREILHNNGLYPR
jgi:hypothetical protein